MCSAPEGNKNAKRENPRSVIVPIRCTQEELDHWKKRVREINAARVARGYKASYTLSSWIRMHLNNAVYIFGLNKRKRELRLMNAREIGTHTKEEWDKLCAEFLYRCVRCGVKCKQVKDHIIPIYQGGSDSISNIQPLCQRCNAQKDSETIDWRVDGKTYSYKPKQKKGDQYDI